MTTNVSKTAFITGGSAPVTIDNMARRLRGAELVIYPDAGHGGIFQYHTQFVPKALAFLAA